MKALALCTSSVIQKEVPQAELTQSRHTENARKIQRLLERRREMLAEQKSNKFENAEKQPEKPQKATVSNVKDIPLQKSEPTTSEEYDGDDDDERPETLTENSESCDSNDSLRHNADIKDVDKGY